MKYTAVNELSNFQFHDSVIESAVFRDGCMVWELAALNVVKQNSQNDTGIDMCINKAVMTLENATIESIVFGGEYMNRDCQILDMDELPETTN